MNRNTISQQKNTTERTNERTFFSAFERAIEISYLFMFVFYLSSVVFRFFSSSFISKMLGDATNGTQTVRLNSKQVFFRCFLSFFYLHILHTMSFADNARALSHTHTHIPNTPTHTVDTNIHRSASHFCERQQNRPGNLCVLHCIAPRFACEYMQNKVGKRQQQQ